MGAWGHTNFDNDDALDFLNGFREEPTADTLLKALAPILETAEEEEYIEAPDASAALAAAEIVAALVGRPSPTLPDEIPALLENLLKEKVANIQKVAHKAVKQILKESELQELWAEGGEPNEWQAVQRDLLIRLK